jgi:hypothetical protein
MVLLFLVSHEAGPAEATGVNAPMRARMLAMRTSFLESVLIVLQSCSPSTTLGSTISEVPT